MPPRRWPDVTGKRRRGGFLPDEDRFDPLFFSISPTEAAMMDPQQRLFLETAWKALEDAGYATGRSRACAAASSSAPARATMRSGSAIPAGSPIRSALMGNVTSILAARIAYLLNLQGPERRARHRLLVVAGGGPSGLREPGRGRLRHGAGRRRRGDQHAEVHRRGDRGRHAVAATAAARTFDAAADGFVCGEGGGAVVLKRLAERSRDGDEIHGVIRGSGINQDGRTNGITAPSAPSQAALEVEVYRRARHRPGHDRLRRGARHRHAAGRSDRGRGADRRPSAGPPIARQFCALGSVKTNIGHALTAAGIAGLLKVLLMLRHRRIPPLVGFTAANPRIDFAATPFYLPTTAAAWSRPTGPRRAAVSSFGFSGTNAHLVVEEPPAAPRRAPAEGPFLFLLSGRSDEARRTRATQLAEHLASGASDLRDIAFTLAAGREHYPHRLAVVAADLGELRAALQAWLAGNRDPNILAGEAKAEGPGPALTALGERVAQDAGDAKNLRILADLYVQGASFDWTTLPGTAGGRRCALPGYPFDRMACNIALDAAPAPTTDGDMPAASKVDADALATLEQALAARPTPDLAAQAAAFQSVEALGPSCAGRRLRRDGAVRAATSTPWPDCARLLGIVAAKQRLHDALVDMLVREQVLAREGDLLRVRGAVPTQDLAAERQRLAQATPELAPFLVLLAHCIEGLPQVLTGRMTATEVLFPDGRMDLVEPIYQGSRLAEHFNGLLADAVAALAAGIGRPVRILEIGAGTGGATAGILDALVRTSTAVAEYPYTDISRGFVQFGQQRFGRARLHAVRRARHRTRSGGAGLRSPASTSSSPPTCCTPRTTSAGRRVTWQPWPRRGGSCC